MKEDIHLPSKQNQSTPEARKNGYGTEMRYMAGVFLVELKRYVLPRCAQLLNVFAIRLEIYGEHNLNEIVSLFAYRYFVLYLNSIMYNLYRKNEIKLNEISNRITEQIDSITCG